ncbi:hypothetical protein J1N35_043376 [Gossypium stocksii]|uniref:Uncharacterized protein n=1 Tax=Gossypium stocksii TaxID=47602 RepID=A0A9D3U791_9ROSI|nr:hypothetical protein J1N35_043376 [Gossypium stocksii]
MRHNTRRSNSRDRCVFHNDVRHKTEDCFTLKDAIDEVVRNNELAEFVDYGVSQQGQSSRDDPKGKQNVRGTIHMIVGTNEEWSTSSTKRKAHLNGVMPIGSPKRPHQQER